ncbi:rho GTPase-activating protein REN1-like isoform X1 [Musa acuminata AAA Group]|uniref:rho GTPase-activating protein REN1-like isoform X1 n=1 Tax=Musa acuminata AAA Group TaxID=214697 RepID=UPI0031D88542
MRLSQMASSQSGENVVTQCKNCRCGEADTKFWITRASDNPDKQTNTCPNCNVLKSGPLFISSKGIGWTSWKKRWFVLTRTSLVFFKTDPAALPQKGSEANITLGGIDLNNSGSVVIKPDKKILTVLFPDGRDGRAFTLKAETSEDLYEWKAALENALLQAPSAALPLGQNGIIHNDKTESTEASGDQLRDIQPVKSTIVGSPILLALEDIDGSPSFLEKALRFIEQHGIKVEGILRQSADVEEVKRRVREYEQGKVEFSSDEDAHVVGDCIKYVLRELPTSPVPASCCTALVEAYRTGRESRVDSLRAAIYETFPEPNRHLVQRILKMMQTVASHKTQNRMSLPALAACMAPLLLRPLLAGDCEFEDDFNMGGDGSIQLLKAAAAANHAQAIVIILLEKYDIIFDEDLLHEDSMSSELYSDSGDGDVEDDDSTDNDMLDDDECLDEHNGSNDSTDNDIPEDDGYHDEHNGLEADIGDDSEHSSSETIGESNSNVGSNPCDDKFLNNQKRDGASLQDNDVPDASKFLADTAHNTLSHDVCHQKSSSTSDIPYAENSSVLKCRNLLHDESNAIASHDRVASVAYESVGDDIPTSTSMSHILPSSDQKAVDKSNQMVLASKRPTVWGRTSAKRNLPMESMDLSSKDGIAVQQLENTKNDLQNKISKEVKGNEILQESLERRKEALHERRLALERDIEKLREQLQTERDLRASLESGLMNMRPGHISFASAMDSKTRADLEEVALAEADIVTLKQKVADLRGQLSRQLKRSYASLCESCSKHIHSRDHSAENDALEDVNNSLGDQHGSFLKQAVQDSVSGGARDLVPAKEQELPSLKEVEPQAQNRESCSQNMITSGTRNTPSNKDSMSKFSSNNEDTKTQAQCLPSSPTAKPQSEQLNTNRSSMESPVSKHFTSLGENITAADHKNVETQSQESVPSSDYQPSQKQKTDIANPSSNLSQGLNKVLPSNEEPVKARKGSALKKFSLWDEKAKKEVQDPSLSNKHPSHEQQPSDMTSNNLKPHISASISSSEDVTVSGHSGATTRFSSRPEETASSSSSSSALAKLTNRLNFLKERRAQLVNDLQVARNSLGPGPDGPPPRTNSR